MLILEDVAELRAQPCEVYDWFRNLVDNYKDWHPDHVSCRYVRGKPLRVGSVLCVEEYLHGRLHKLRFKLTSIQPDRGIGYRIAPGLRGGFGITPTKCGARLEAKVCIGWNLPIIGPVVDFVVTTFFKAELNDLRVHMHEEGENLSSLLGTGEKNSVR
jgi:hypothetical protein